MSTSTSMVKREDTGPERTDDSLVLTPLVDIYENDDEVLLVADLPGVAKENLDIQLNKGVLSLGGARALTVEEGSGPRQACYRREFLIGSEIDGAAIAAQLSDGVLRLRLPKSQTRKPRKIAVTTG